MSPSYLSLHTSSQDCLPAWPKIRSNSAEPGPRSPFSRYESYCKHFFKPLGHHSADAILALIGMVQRG